MKKKVLTIKMLLGYPPQGKFEKFKKGEKVIKRLLPLWKIHIGEVLGAQVYVREVPSDEEDRLTIKSSRKTARSI